VQGWVWLAQDLPGPAPGWYSEQLQELVGLAQDLVGLVQDLAGLVQDWVGMVQDLAGAALAWDSEQAPS
jgi:hypothetical protein